MTTLWLLSVAAAIEAITGVALIITPQIVSELLLGADLDGAGIAVGRVAGAALLALALVCWIIRHDANKTPALTAMLAYNLLVTAYLMYLGLGGQLVGVLLWPAIAIHAILTLMFAYVFINDRNVRHVDAKSSSRRPSPKSASKSGYDDKQ
jgi:hypothetical protein